MKKHKIKDMDLIFFWLNSTKSFTVLYLFNCIQHHLLLYYICSIVFKCL